MKLFVIRFYMPDNYLHRTILAFARNEMECRSEVINKELSWMEPWTYDHIHVSHIPESLGSICEAEGELWTEEDRQ